MSAKRKRLDEFSVGITVLAAIVILIGGVIWGKGITFNSKHDIYEIQFPEVYGLKEGSAVLVQGVAHGKVGAITLNPEGARVEIMLDQDVEIYDNYEVLLFTPQLMGGRMVTIDPGGVKPKEPEVKEAESDTSDVEIDAEVENADDTVEDSEVTEDTKETDESPKEPEKEPELLPPGTLLRGQVPAGMGEVMATSGEVLEEMLSMIQQLSLTARRVDSIFVKSDMVGKVDQTLGDLTEMTSSMKEDLERTTTSLRDGADQIRNSTVEFNTLLTDNRPRMDSLMVRLNRIATEAEGFSSNLETFSTQLTSQRGSLGKLVYSDSLHDELVRAISDTDSLINRLKKEGIKVSIF